MGRYDYYWPRYVPVAERQRKAASKIAALKKKGQSLSPVSVDGREITTTFWGRSWCQNLERYSDYSNRLPRGRSYVRNGSVIDLQITHGQVKSRVQGSELYNVKIGVARLDPSRWHSLVHQCSGKIDSLVELLQGKLSHSVMEVITHKDQGLFPKPKQIKFECSCPDWASMCKHVAATLYGVGARLDEQPDLLFLLRHVNSQDLITHASKTATFNKKMKPSQDAVVLDDADLSQVFGIDLDGAKKPAPTASSSAPSKANGKSFHTSKTKQKNRVGTRSNGNRKLNRRRGF